MDWSGVGTPAVVVRSDPLLWLKGPTMPAETHSYRDPLEISNVLEMLWVVLGQPGEVPDASASLSDLGLDTDLALLDLFDAAGEEFGERTLADVDLEDLQTLRTLGDMAEAIIRWTTTTDGPDRP